jgi:hypothetical protein
MALTIMYLVVRFMRVASAEALGARIPIIKNVPESRGKTADLKWEAG